MPITADNIVTVLFVFNLLLFVFLLVFFSILTLQEKNRNKHKRQGLHYLEATVHMDCRTGLYYVRVNT